MLQLVRATVAKFGKFKFLFLINRTRITVPRIPIIKQISTNCHLPARHFMTVSFYTADKPREIVYNNSVIKKLARKIHHVSGYVNEIPDFTRPFDLNQIMTIIKAHCLFAHYPTLSIQGHRLSLLSDPVRRSQVGRPLRVWSNCCFSSFISITASVVDQTRRRLVFDVWNLPRIQKMK